jgi:hypothetical protein
MNGLAWEEKVAAPVYVPQLLGVTRAAFGPPSKLSLKSEAGRSGRAMWPLSKGSEPSTAVSKQTVLAHCEECRNVESRAPKLHQ